MPELPDLVVYIEALEPRLADNRLTGIRLKSPFLLRSVDPPLEATFDRQVLAIRRLGKRIAIELEAKYFLVIHLMIAGRLHWKEQPVALRGRYDLAAFDFSSGSLLLTEAGSRKRASLIVIQGPDSLQLLDPGAAHRSSGSSMRKRSPTTAPAVRPGANCWQIEASRNS